jgi:hypothetical protein
MIKLQGKHKRALNRQKEGARVKLRSYFALWLSMVKDAKEKVKQARRASDIERQTSLRRGHDPAIGASDIEITVQEEASPTSGSTQARRKGVANVASDLVAASSQPVFSMASSTAGQARDTLTQLVMGAETPKAKAIGLYKAPSEMAKTPEEVMVNIMDEWAEIGRVLKEPNVNVIDSRALTTLLEDSDFIKRLEYEKIRPDQVIMLFQRLDTLKRGQVDVEFFIEGLRRHLFSVDGLDVASIKSCARRLYQDAMEMTTCASALNETFLGVDCKLRGVSVVGDDSKDAQDVNDEDLNDDVMMQAKEYVLAKENKRLKDKIATMTGHVTKLMKILENGGDEFVSSLCYIDTEHHDEDDVDSMTSVQSGHD